MAFHSLIRPSTAALDFPSTNGFHSLAWHLLCVLHEALSCKSSAADRNAEPCLPPLEPLVWTPEGAVAERLLRPSHRLLALKTRVGLVAAGSPAEARSFSQGEARYTPAVFVLPRAVFSRPCGCEMEYPALLSEAALPHPLAFVGGAAQLRALTAMLREALVGPAREHCTEDIDFAAEHAAIVPDSWPSHSSESLERAYTLNPYGSETGAVELVLPRVINNQKTKDEEKDKEEEEGAQGKLRIQCVHGLVRVYEDGNLVLVFDGDFQHLRHAHPHRQRLCEHCVPEVAPPSPQWAPPPFAVTFLANAPACAACCRTVTLVVWVAGRGVLVDPCSACRSVLARSGLLPRIAAIVVTHAHVDPISGILPFYISSSDPTNESETETKTSSDDQEQQQEQQKRIPLYTTETIFGSLCRMVEAFVDLRHMVDFRAVRAGEGTLLGVGDATLVCRYALHTVPALALEVACEGRALWHGAAGLHRPALCAALRRAGTLTRAREAELLHGGSARAALLVRGVGLAPVHTPVAAVRALPPRVRARTVLVNMSRGRDVPGLRAAAPHAAPPAGARSAQYGLAGTIALPPPAPERTAGRARAADVLALVCGAPYLRSLAAPDVAALLAALVEQRYDANAIVVDTSNNNGDSNYNSNNSEKDASLSAKTNANAPPRPRGLVFIVEEGTAALFNGDRTLSFPTNVPLSLLERGDVFADMDGTPCRVVARTALRVLAFPARLLSHASFCNSSIADGSLSLPVPVPMPLPLLLPSTTATAASTSTSTTDGDSAAAAAAEAAAANAKRVADAAKTAAAAVAVARFFGRAERRESAVLRALHHRPFLVQSLTQSSTFRPLTHEQIGVLASCVAAERRLARGERLIRQGDVADRALYIVRAGTLGVLVARGDGGRRVEMARVGPGSCVGEMALVRGLPRTADVVALTPASVLRLPPDEMDAVMLRFPQIRFLLNAVITSRIDGLFPTTPFKVPRPRAPAPAPVHPPVLPACINVANHLSPSSVVSP